MFYLITPHGQLPHPIESGVDPFPVRNTLVSRGYETMDDLRWNEGLMPCVDCGGRIWPQFSCREELMREQICHACWCRRKSLWRAA